MEYKNVAFKVGHIDEDDKFFRFSGMASTHDLDRGDDRFAPGAFTESLKTVTPVALWVHQMREPIGIIEEAKELPNGLFIKAVLPKEDTLVTGRVIPQIKIGSVRAMSVGFEPLDVAFETIDKKVIRVISKATLFEVSPVPIPMNPNAVITDFKDISDMEFKAVTPSTDLPLAPRETVWKASAAVKRIRENTGSAEKPSASYRKQFMFFDREDKDNFGAYKLPFADFIDGRFRAVPRALFAIRGALSGARGGVEGPTDAERTRITGIVNRYLDRLNADSDKAYLFEDVRNISDKESFDRLLKETGLFTKSAGEHLASLLSKRSESDSSGIKVITGFTDELNELKQLLK